MKNPIALALIIMLLAVLAVQTLIGAVTLVYKLAQVAYGLLPKPSPALSMAVYAPIFEELE